MHTFNSLSALLLFSSPLLASAAVITGAAAKQLVKPKASDPFTLIAIHSTSPIHLQPVNAQRNHFFIGNTTVTSCPDLEDIECPPPGNVTVLQTSARGYCNLVRTTERPAYSVQHMTMLTSARTQDVVVPGGQAVYVEATGALAYTVAHSNVFPRGAKRRSFALDRLNSEQNSFTYSVTGKSSGWLACPVVNETYQVFANVVLEDKHVPQKNASACIGFDALTTNYTLPGPAAWQYD